MMDCGYMRQLTSIECVALSIFSHSRAEAIMTTLPGAPLASATMQYTFPSIFSVLATMQNAFSNTSHATEQYNNCMHFLAPRVYLQRFNVQLLAHQLHR